MSPHVRRESTIFLIRFELDENCAQRHDHRIKDCLWTTPNYATSLSPDTKPLCPLFPKSNHAKTGHYSAEGAYTNQAESRFSRIRGAELATTII